MGASPQGAINEGSYQCWKLIKEPSPLGSWATVLIWNTSGFFYGKMIYLWCCGPEAGRASGKLRAGQVLGSFATTVNLTQADAAPVAGHRSCPTAFWASRAMIAEGDLVWVLWNAVRVAYRSGPRPFAPHGPRNTDQQHRGAP